MLEYNCIEMDLIVMRCKRKIFLQGNRTRVRKFIDCLNKLEIFEEKIEYPVYHPSRYEENKNSSIKEVDGIDKYVVLGESRLVRDENGENYLAPKLVEKDIKKIRSTYHKGYFDFNYSLHFKDDLNKICFSKKISDKKKQLRDYIINKFKTLDNMKYDDGLNPMLIDDDERFCFSFVIIDDDNPKYEYRYYFGIDLFMSENKDKEKNTCEFSMLFTSFRFDIYV